MEQSGTKESSFPTLLHLLLSILIVGVIISGIWFAGTEMDLEQLNTVLEVTTAFILGSIAAAIAYKQYQAGKRQADIKNTLRDLQSKPTLDVINHELNRDSIDIYLANFGFGPAYDLQLELDVECTSSHYDFEPTQMELRQVAENDDEIDLAGNAILPKSNIIKYRASDIEIRDTSEDREQPFPIIFEEIAVNTSSETQCTIDIRVTGKDPFENQLSPITVRESCKITVNDIQHLDSYGVNDVLSQEPN